MDDKYFKERYFPVMSENIVAVHHNARKLMLKIAKDPAFDGIRSDVEWIVQETRRVIDNLDLG